jgi:hypothetical protein
MNRSVVLYTFRHKAAGVFMLLALLWLTISLPFVNEARQVIAKTTSQNNTDTKTSSTNPLTSATEEKTPSPSTLSEEYLHHQEEPIHFSGDKLNHTHHHSYDVYVAFHGELISPPPEA